MMRFTRFTKNGIVLAAGLLSLVAAITLMLYRPAYSRDVGPVLPHYQMIAGGSGVNAPIYLLNTQTGRMWRTYDDENGKRVWESMAPPELKYAQP